MELRALKLNKESLIEKNELLQRENFNLQQMIGRLKNDLLFLEHIARQELGLVGKEDLILKPKQIEGIVKND
ncbi:MAG: hypothetical protein HQK79_13420 [Desulfobacterales bacterium]|nr:hypothetical protein [Desulfobacterales bacterium]MBF0395987.1 hypothetical protein [Desulfobacterales bacterium]